MRHTERSQAGIEKRPVNSGRRNLQKPLGNLEKAVNVYPDFLEAQLRLGTNYMDLREWNKAEATLRRVLEIDRKRQMRFSRWENSTCKRSRTLKLKKRCRAGWRCRTDRGRDTYPGTSLLAEGVR